MKKSILITGMSGSGKSTLGKKLRASGYVVHDIEDIPGMFTTIDSRTGEILTEWDTNNLDQIKYLIFSCSKEKLSELIAHETNEIAFYCGTATNIHDIVPLFDEVILLQASPEIIKHRLSTRTTHDFARDPKMQDWILELKNPFETALMKEGAVVVNADGDVDETLQRVITLF